MPAVVRARATGVTAAQVFHALSDDTRLAIMEMLRGGERCVCDLQGALDAAQSRLSFHLKVLKDAGLVSDRKAGRWSYYTLNVERLSEAGEVLESFTKPSPNRSTLQLHSLVRAPRDGAVSRKKKEAAAGSSGDACCN
jgi:ArsR family transcriptional regulator